ncbi:uncharacterized protein METZ01_LOCUS54436 [marine metagenome]|uniref:Uncharacterized protein n=1 Tax=marine metagenome TaxID=408172 RepID=A0A381SBW7_9ZZZZ
MASFALGIIVTVYVLHVGPGVVGMRGRHDRI